MALFYMSENLLNIWNYFVRGKNGAHWLSQSKSMKMTPHSLPCQRVSQQAPAPLVKP